MWSWPKLIGYDSSDSLVCLGPLLRLNGMWGDSGPGLSPEARWNAGGQGRLPCWQM